MFVTGWPIKRIIFHHQIDAINNIQILNISIVGYSPVMLMTSLMMMMMMMMMMTWTMPSLQVGRERPQQGSQQVSKGLFQEVTQEVHEGS